MFCILKIFLENSTRVLTFVCFKLFAVCYNTFSFNLWWSLRKNNKLKYKEMFTRDSNYARRDFRRLFWPLDQDSISKTIYTTLKFITSNIFMKSHD